MARFRKILCDSTTRGAPAYSPTSDALGLFPGEGEDETKFAERVDFLNRELEMLEDGSSDLRDWIGSSPEVPENLRKQAGELTWKRFRFRAEWVPAWFSSRRTGCFSAGVLLEVDHRLPLVFLHSAFLRKSRRMGYDAAETLAHEMVHAVRIAFPGSAYEEFFPCQVHRSGFRRVFGNLFRRWWIPVLFFGGLAPLENASGDLPPEPGELTGFSSLPEDPWNPVRPALQTRCGDGGKGSTPASGPEEERAFRWPHPAASPEKERNGRKESV